MREVFNEKGKVGWKAQPNNGFLCMSFDDLSLYKQLPIAWREALESRVEDTTWQGVEALLQDARAQGVCYPPQGLELAAFRSCVPSAVKVVILGQDPYHGLGQAHGLAFSVSQGVAWPPSLRNILRELADDVGPESLSLQALREEGVLEHLPRQGVLLLNDVLTVSEGLPGSHAHFGWQGVTGSVMEYLLDSDRPCVFILWGKLAREHSKRINHPRHLVLEAPHPSPLSAYRGFFGSKPFSKTNAWLEACDLEPIHW